MSAVGGTADLLRTMPDADPERDAGCAADGTLVPITEGSTLPILHRVTHGGIVETPQLSFAID